MLNDICSCSTVHVSIQGRSYDLLFSPIVQRALVGICEWYHWFKSNTVISPLIVLSSITWHMNTASVRSTLNAIMNENIKLYKAARNYCNHLFMLWSTAQLRITQAYLLDTHNLTHTHTHTHTYRYKRLTEIMYNRRTV